MKFKKSIHGLIRYILLILVIFIVFACCLILNHVLDKKIQKQEVNSINTIYEALYPSITPEQSITP